MKAGPLQGYLCSLPERVVRSVAALGGGVVRQVSEVTLPARVRRTRLYRTLVESTLRFLVEQVGQVENAYAKDDALPDDFLVRRTAGNMLEAAGIVAFRASPVWVLAALADLTGAGRELVGEIAGALQAEGLLERNRRFETVDQLLDGLERTAGCLAETVNTPPLDVAGLREEWARLRSEARRIPATALPSPAMLWTEWRDLRHEAAAQGRSTFELSSAIALSSIRRLPGNARWLSRATGVAARRAGRLFAQGLLDHYSATLAEIRETGFAEYATRELGPYFRGAMNHFSPARESLTERLLRRPRRQAGAPHSSE